MKDKLYKDLSMRLTCGVKIYDILNKSLYALSSEGTYLRLHRVSPYYVSNSKEFKPIYHPLSDLTKPITHKGESVIFTKSILTPHEIDLMENNKILGDMSVNGIPYQKVQMMLKYHIDINNLIESGKAINVNTLKENPYK